MRASPILVLLLAAAAGCRSSGPPPAAAPPVQSARLPSAQTRENQAINDRIVQGIRQRIAGRESEQAAQVFRNVQLLKTVPAGTFLVIMNAGYATALGVTCMHCHVEGDSASDDKRPKRAARQMAVMHRSINTQLQQMTELASTPAENRAINCSTCHRGRVDPTAPQ